MIEILYLSVVLSVVVLFIYTYIVPWTKGTYVIDGNHNCGCPNLLGFTGYCCKLPSQPDGDGWCESIPCNKIRIEKPTKSQIKTFIIYTSSVLSILLIISIVIMVKNISKKHK